MLILSCIAVVLTIVWFIIIPRHNPRPWHIVSGVLLIILCGGLIIASDHADAKTIRPIHCRVNRHYKRVCMPGFVDRVQPPTVTVTDALNPSAGNFIPLTLPLVDTYLDGPWVGSIRKVSTIGWNIPFGIFLSYSLGNISPPTFQDTQPSVTFLDRLYVGTNLVWQYSENVPIPTTFTQGPATNPQIFQHGLKALHAASQQFNPELVILPHQQLHFVSSVSLNFANNQATALEYGYAFGVNPAIVNGYGSTLGPMDLEIGYNLETIDNKRSTNGPLY